MFGFFRASKDANSAQAFLVNFVSYSIDSVGNFGFEKGSELIAKSQWAAGADFFGFGPEMELRFRLCIPFSSFFATISQEKNLRVSSPTKESLVRVFATEDFNGFQLNAYTASDVIQISAVNRPELNLKVTSRAKLLVSRFSSKGAVDMTKILNGDF
jgi:hypothetical protein